MIVKRCMRVHDRIKLGLEEDEEKDEPADRSYWQSTASPETLAITDSLLSSSRMSTRA